MEFEMYRHHLREQNGNSNLGWCRNMWHSLVQQVVRQDLALYGLNVAARADKRTMLISLPYYTKFEMPGESNPFKHIDMSVPQFLKSGRFGNVVQTAISLDDEDSGGCTIIVPGFQNKIEKWWSEVVKQGEDTYGFTHSVETIYKLGDATRKFVPVVCKRGEIRLTMSQIIHGYPGKSTGQRRVIFPWLVAIELDHERMEVREWGSWNDISGANRDLMPLKVSPSGCRHKFFLGSGRFPGAIEIRGVSAVGDALVGARRWDSSAVLRERDAILGADESMAKEAVERHQARMKSAWREAFAVMKEVEEVEFGEKSYFRSIRGR